MLLRRPDDIFPVRRNLQILALFLVAPDIAEQTRLAAVHIRGPCLLLGHFCQALRICRGAFLVDLAAARVHDRFAVGRQTHARERLTIITFVMRHLARHEIRRICDPDVALALGIEDPSYTRRMGRARQTIWKWRTQHLLEREAFTQTDNRQQDATDSNNEKLE